MAARAARPALNVLRLKPGEFALPFASAGSPAIFDVLRLEEALFRRDDRHWCVITQGSDPAVVMGISGKPEKLIDVRATRDRCIPVVKRFTGGGTVVVDPSTLFVGFVAGKDAVPVEPLFPRDLMQWTADAVYAPVFERVAPSGADSFGLIENDYVVGSRKVGGNAQSLARNRLCHHTSFLWDFDDELMELLTLPEKRPEYRDSRDHTDFVTRLGVLAGPGGGRVGDVELFVDELLARLDELFDVAEPPLDEAVAVLEAPGEQRRSNKIIKL